MRGPSGQLLANLPLVLSYMSGTCLAQGSHPDKLLKTSYYWHSTGIDSCGYTFSNTVHAQTVKLKTTIITKMNKAQRVHKKHTKTLGGVR